MRPFTTLLVICLLFPGLSGKISEINARSIQQQNNSEVSPVFEENKGQVRDQNWESRPDVLFSGEIPGLAYYIRNNGISYQLYKVNSVRKHKAFKDIRNMQATEEVSDSIGIYRIDINWINASLDFGVEKGTALEGYNNYYNVPDNTSPALFVRQFEDVTIKSLWPGIDLHVFSNNGILETDWHIEKAEDYKQIQFEILGADLSVDEQGILIMKTPFGEIHEGKLKVYQHGKKIDAQWKSRGNIVGFEILNYMPGQPLLIDPPVLVWGTYYGGIWKESGNAISTDDEGNVFLAGQTQSLTHIATTGAHQASNQGFEDAFLVKFDSTGVRLWGTYYGGNQSDNGLDCAIDGNGNVYLCGLTKSTYNIATVGCHQPDYNGGTNGGDAFLAKFNSDGIRQWGTYYGGTGNEIGFSCATDPYGNVYLAGKVTASNSHIATEGAHQPTLQGGSDAFLVKFNEGGTRLWGTYFGGTASETGYSCATDVSGNVYLAGHTIGSDTLIATEDAHQTSNAGGLDAFLVKFDGDGVRQWGTYYGGSYYDEGFSCATDADGNIYLAGRTESNSNIATNGAHQESISGGYDDAFFVKFNSSGVRQWGTYYGGERSDVGNACATDVSGNIYLAGTTESHNGIATELAHQNAISGNLWEDAFLAKFSSEGERLWGTYYGGMNWDSGKACATAPTGGIYIAGTTNSIDNLATPGAHQELPMSGTNAFLGKFDDDGNTGLPTNTIPGLISLYPNPVLDFIVIEADESMIGQPIKIFSQDGREVIRGNLESEKTVIDTRKLVSGTYLLSIGDDLKLVNKIIKQ